MSLESGRARVALLANLKTEQIAHIKLWAALWKGDYTGPMAEPDGGLLDMCNSALVRGGFREFLTSSPEPGRATLDLIAAAFGPGVADA